MKLLSTLGDSTSLADITGVTAGNALTGGGTSGTVTINHEDTSSQATVNNSGFTFIQDVTLDTYGHVTGLTSTTIGTATDSDKGLAAFNGDYFSIDGSGIVSISGLTLANIAGAVIQTASESFADNDTTIMTSAAIQDKIAADVSALGYITSSVSSLTSLTTIGAAGATTNFAAGDVTIYNPVNDGNPRIFLGSAVTESLRITSNYSSGTQTLESVNVDTLTDSGTANMGSIILGIDGVTVGDFRDGGYNIATNKGILCAGTEIMTDSSGTMTLKNIDAVDSTTKATIQAAQVVHYQFLGYSIGDGTNYEMPQNLTDGQAPFEHADTSSSDGLTIPAASGTNVSEMIRMGGHVMPRDGTLTKWMGWASSNDNNNSFYVALFRWSPVDNNNTDIDTSHGDLTLLVTFTGTGKTNDKVREIALTSFTDASVSAGDILFTQVKTGSGKTVYFNTTLEVEL